MCVWYSGIPAGLLKKENDSRIGLFLSSLALVPGHNAPIPKNLLQRVEKRSTGIPHLSTCVLNFLRLLFSLSSVWSEVCGQKRGGKRFFLKQK